MSCWSVSGEIGGSFLGEHPSNVEINKVKKIRNNFITSFVNENNKKNQSEMDWIYKTNLYHLI